MTYGAYAKRTEDEYVQRTTIIELFMAVRNLLPLFISVVSVIAHKYL